MEEIDQIIKQLRERGLKVTPQRVAIIEVLIEQRDSHPGARLVYEEAKKKKKLIDHLCEAQRASRRESSKTVQFENLENRKGSMRAYESDPARTARDMD